MPRDRFELLRFVVALLVLAGFSLTGLMARISHDQGCAAVSTVRPAIAVRLVARQP